MVDAEHVRGSTESDKAEHFSESVPVSVLILTLNEEQNIRACLESVKWAADIIVVDSFSTDGTVAIAREYTTKIYQVALGKLSDAGVKRNWAMSNVDFAHEWVLSLDADDRIPEALSTEIAEVLRSPRVDGFLVRQRYIFMGQPLRFCLGPLYQLKLFKHRLYRCDEAIHERPLFGGRVAYLKGCYLQEGKKTLFEYIERHNLYSSREAEARRAMRKEPLTFSLRQLLVGDAVTRKRLLTALWVRMPMRPAVLFLLFFVFRLGFLDGKRGLIYSLLRGCGYEFLINIKQWEMEHGKREEID